MSTNTAKNSEKRVAKALYESELKKLHVELVVLQPWVVATGARVLVIVEGPDSAGKGGAITRTMG